MVRAYIRLIEHARVRDGRASPLPQAVRGSTPTVAGLLVGIVGGIVVGMTSVGSGSLRSSR